MDTALIWIFGIFVVGMGFSLWALLAPDAWMRVDRLSWGWMYRGGRDAELTQSGRTWIQFRGAIGIIGTLIACGGLLAVHTDAIERKEAAEQQQAREEDQRSLADQWGSTGGIRLVVLTGSDDIEPLTSAQIAATVVGFAPVTEAGTSPSYFRDLRVFRTYSDMVTDRSEIDAIHESTDLVIGTYSMCQVSAVTMVSSDDETIVLDLAYSRTTMFNREVDCASTLSRSVDLIPIDLGEPLDGRSVHLVDGTELVEITE